jgi:hypothetical protein
VALVAGLGAAGPAAGSVRGGSPVRLAAPGSQLWASRYQGPGSNGGDDDTSSVAVSPDGSTVFVTGFSEGPGGLGQFDYATIAYSASTGAQR